MKDFLSKHGWTVEKSLRQDVSPRQYYRVAKQTGQGAQTAILMQTAPDTADKPEMQNFVDIALWLQDIDLIAPKIYECDTAQGLMILQDFGDTPLANAPEQAKAYSDATKILQHIATQSCPLDLPKYEHSNIHARHRWVIDYYADHVDDKEQAAQEYLNIWNAIEKTLPPCPKGFVHGDYHAANLHWLDGGAGLQSLGILDFQDALHGPAPYDLCNLLEDARVSVPQDIKDECLKHYDEEFMIWYRVLSLQFHSRVIGLFIKIAQEKDNTSYLAHVPRLKAYINENLKNPAFSPLKMFFDDLSLVFED